MMRILRLYAPSLIGDHTLCYVSTNREGNVCINDVETPVLWARAGEPLDGEERAAAMTVVLPPDAKLNEGDFLSVGKYGSDAAALAGRDASAYAAPDFSASPSRPRYGPRYAPPCSRSATRAAGESARTPRGPS